VTSATMGLPPQFRLLQIKVLADPILSLTHSQNAPLPRYVMRSEGNAIAACESASLTCTRNARGNTRPKRSNHEFPSRDISFRRDTSALCALLSPMDETTSRIYLIEHTGSCSSAYYSRSVLLNVINPARRFLSAAYPARNEASWRKAGRNLFVAHTRRAIAPLVVRVSTNPPAVSFVVISFSRKSTIRRRPPRRAADSYESARPVRRG